MFKQFTALSDTYTWPVVIKYPLSGGKFGEIRLDAEFKRMGTTELEALNERARDETVDEKGEKTFTLHYDKLVDGVLVGFKCKNDDGEYVELPQELHDQALGLPGAYKTVFIAFGASITGEKQKN